MKNLSNNSNIKQKFTQGAIINIITQYLSELHLNNGPKYSSHSLYDDSASDSDSDAPSRPPSSCFSSLRGSARTLSLTQFSPSSFKKKKKKRTTRCVNWIQVDMHDSLTSFVVPDGLKQQQIMHVNMYQAGLRKRKVTKDITKFTDGMKCAICHQPHTFEKCPILNDIPYIKKYFISYYLQMNKKQAIHRMPCIYDNLLLVYYLYCYQLLPMI